MTSIVKNQQNPINSSLLLTNIEKLNALNLHFPKIAWPTFVNSSLEIGSSNTLLATPNFKLGSEELSYISTILPTNIFLIAICLLTPENSSSSTTSSPHFSTIETSTFSHLKPPHSPNRPSSRKRFHPYPKSLPNKKPKTNVGQSSNFFEDENDQDEIVQSGSNLCKTAKVKGFNLPPLAQ
jgi:hypothetical protein